MIGQRIRECRLSKNISMKKLAALTGLQVSHLSKIENDKLTPTLATLEKICNALKIDIKDFYKDNEDTVESFTIRLVDELLKEKIIPDPDNIPKETLDLLIAAFKRDIRRIKENK